MGVVPEPYTQQYHQALLDKAVGELAAAIRAWDERDREDLSSHYTLASKIRLHAWSVAAETAALAEFSREVEATR